MAAGRVTGAIDLRKRGGELAGAKKGAMAIGNLLDTLGKNEQIRQERQTMERIAATIASGGTDIGSISQSANQPASFDSGLAGFIQKLGVGNQPSPGGVGGEVNRSIINDALNRALSGLTPEEQQRSREIKAGLKPRASSTATARPTAKSPEETDFDRDIKILNNPKATDGQKEKARSRVRINPNLKEVPAESDIDFAAVLKGLPKEKVGKLDKAFGKAAYEKALKLVKEDALADGVTEESAVAAFNRWWDAAAADADPKGFGKLVTQRPGSQEAIPPVAAPSAAPPSKTPPTTGNIELREEIKQILAGPGTSKQKREAAKAAQQRLKGRPAKLKRLEELRRKAGQ